jgi:aminotransferase
MEMGDAYYRDLLAAYTRKRQMMGEALERIGFDVSWPQGAYYVMANFERFARTHPGYDDDRSACEALIREAGVGSIPGKSFFEHPADGRYWLRFCYAKEFPVLEQACRQLVEAYAVDVVG